MVDRQVRIRRALLQDLPDAGLRRFLDQLGGIWEIIFWMTLPEPLPTELKMSFCAGTLQFSLISAPTGLSLQARGRGFESP